MVLTVSKENTWQRSKGHFIFVIGSEIWKIKTSKNFKLFVIRFSFLKDKTKEKDYLKLGGLSVY